MAEPSYTSPQTDLPSSEMVGLGNEPKSSWPSAGAAAATGTPIDRLRPGSELHKRVLDYLITRIEHSERAMSQFYERWQAQEKRVQAFVNLADMDLANKRSNDAGNVPKTVPIVVPYSFATINTIVTYTMYVFAGRNPTFQVGSYKSETIRNARNMETMLQFQGDVQRFIKNLYVFLQHTQIYGLGIMRVYWRELFANRTTRASMPQLGAGGQQVMTPTSLRRVEMVYQGNVVEVQDPYLFFPDPRVPMTSVNRRGEYTFWRLFEGRHILKREEAAGTIKYVDFAGEMLPKNDAWTVGRVNAAGGEMFPALTDTRNASGSSMRNFVQIDQGTIELIPAELGLSDSTVPEKWIFTILNKTQIVQADRYDTDHGMHPVSVAEPYALGSGFGALGMADYVAPLQDYISWLINSRMDNVRRVLNDSFIYDPSAIEEKGLKTPGPGRLIRLKQSALGRDVRTIIQQIPAIDVTKGNVQDIEMFFGIGERVSSVSDNVMGIQDSGGRKTATEIRSASGFATSRLATVAKIISSQAMVDITEQMCVNTQQYLSEGFYLQVTGQDGAKAPIFISPEMLVGNFHYPIHDGTLPVDTIALLDVWKEVMMAVLQDPQLRMSYDIGRLFEYVAELGGAKNISGFRLQQMSPEAIAQGAQAGNLVPINQGQAGSGQRQTPGVVPAGGRFLGAGRNAA